MGKARRTAAAEHDFENIAYQIAVERDCPETARKVLWRLDRQCDRLHEMASVATLGTAAPEIGEGVRLFSIERWVILFRYEQDGILVLRIADGSQNYLSWKLSE